MGLSALNAQRFKFNFIDSPICEQCNTATESPLHYFLQCQAYGVARQTLLDKLGMEQQININNQQSTLNFILYGTYDKHVNSRIISAVTEYMTNTNRFL